MNLRKFISECLVFLAVVGLTLSVHAAPINGVWSIESGSVFSMAGVGNAPLAGGTDGGLKTGVYQPDLPPTTGINDLTGAATLIDPLVFVFFGFPTYASTNEFDPVDGTTRYPAPSINDNGDGTITADLTAWDTMWNNTHFNQGAPKAAGGNASPSGSYDPQTGAYTLVWDSLIVGGPFNGFLGEWSLMGVGPLPDGPTDTDSDGIDDPLDNCVQVANFGQLDYDLDGIGDACDCDADADTFNSIADKGPDYQGAMIPCQGMDCDDLLNSINPGGIEICGNGVDENCDGADFTACTEILGKFCIEAGSTFNMPGVGGAPVLGGTDCGFITGQFQPHYQSNPADVTSGSDRIVDPNTFIFFGFPVYISTNPVDPVDGVTTFANPPMMYDNGNGTLSGQTQSWDALWNSTHFNQGSPKDNPGALFDAPAPIGHFDPATTAYDLDWHSLIIGGPFDGFTGEWHLVGTMGTVDPCGDLGGDSDGDGVCCMNDNCCDVANPGQEDCDGDGIGDACDDDLDGDGYTVAQGDCDDTCGGEHICPTCPEIPCDGIDQDCMFGDLQDCTCTDTDLDGVNDCTDNCIDIYNPGQEDCDGDAIGDVCDDDLDGDGYTVAMGDCDDSCGGGAINPGVPDIPCNGVDEDCSGADETDCSCTDTDSDGVNDCDDNCIDVPNGDQADLDNDGLGNACDDDADGDMYTVAMGDCDDLNAAVNPGVAEFCDNGLDDDCDGTIDICPPCQAPDADTDGDTVCDSVDNCINDPNLDQADCDMDGQGDVCDTDDDNDGTPDSTDCAVCDPSIPATEIPCDGIDQDCDGSDLIDCSCTDTDGDGVNDCDDNCVDVANPDQADCDMDGQGDACDADDDNDGIPDATDCAVCDPAIPTTEIPCDGIDQDCDGSDLVDCSCIDTDNDGVNDCDDNCVDGPNADQADLDMDGLGDACDADVDGDSYDNTTDCDDMNAAVNPGVVESGDVLCADSIDNDCDGLVDTRQDPSCGAACVEPDFDTDGDSICDSVDNCVEVANADQADCDNDKVGDVCDDDRDGDGYTVAMGDCDDSCITGPMYNPGIVDIPCDGIDQNCDFVDRTDCSCTDADNDGVNDCDDNCVDGANPDQADCDMDGQGDACDADDDNDGTPDAQDCAVCDPAIPATEIPCDGMDQDCDGSDLVDCSCTDTDNDGVNDCDDNCVDVANPDQADCDMDGQGDACDMDDDNDGDPDTTDCAVCDPAIGSGAMDIPCDGIDQNCDGADAVDCSCTDSDGDGVNDCDDNCVDVANPDQANCDMDNEGDACDMDDDNDGDPDTTDCNDCNPVINNNAVETGRHLCTDGVDNDCDGQVDDADPGCDPCGEGDTDTDGDGVCDSADNCDTVRNSDQADCDGDMIGDACDDDRDGDGYTGAQGDCDDSCSGSAIHPDAIDMPCNGVDENCDGSDTVDCSCTDTDDDAVNDCNDNCIDVPNRNQADCDKDGLGDACDADLDGDGYTEAQGDCNDSCGADNIHPGATEIVCNNVDEDCDGSDLKDCSCSDADNDGVNDCNDNCLNDANSHQDDLDGDGTGDVCDPDADGDGYDASTDCNDLDGTINPGATEVLCDNIDQNCDGDPNDGQVCAGFGDIIVKLKGPKKVDSCKTKLKKVKIKIENKDFGKERASTQTVSWTLKNNGQIMDSGIVVLERQQKAQIKLLWDPSTVTGLERGLWEVTATGDGTDPDPSNNSDDRAYKVKGCK